ncbi:hypothetical protein J2T56_002214 [Natronobacillus azotifigens]|uniref:Uncharacterized protein n=1 Tax=Natronobacillus azotifigens TaxID=472978 RepID=A0A9J6RF71_9BACI|nr:hypothetical protein [Natronobacillus azotifigens]MCZ0703979.1 hypothetical protein [Natronobacillus azotifigens]
MRKKTGIILLAAIMILTLVPSTTFASNHEDTEFSFYLTNSTSQVNTQGRAKQNSTSTYVNLSAVPTGFINLDVQGFRPISSTGTNQWRNETIGGTVTVSTGQWLVRQLVFEHGGRSARLRFSRYGGNGAIAGEWSPDSVGSYRYAN